MSQHERSKGDTDTWLTPPSVIAALGHFDLDPCGHPLSSTAKHLIILPDCGLEAKWFGRVWLNPPYSNVGEWLEKLAYHGRGIALVFARTETRWAQSILPKATSVFFPARRFTFLKADGTAPSFSAGAPSMLLAFGESPNWFDIGPGWVAK